MLNKLTFTCSIIIIFVSISLCKQDFQFYTVTASSLIVRNEPNIKSTKIAQISKGSIVTLVETTSKIETIDNKTSHWVKIKTTDGIIGYVFSGYLNECEKKNDNNTNTYNELIGIIYSDENKLPITFDKAYGGALDKCNYQYSYHFFIKGDDAVVTLEKIHQNGTNVKYQIIDLIIFDSNRYWVSSSSCKINHKYNCSLFFTLEDNNKQYKPQDIYKPLKAFIINKDKNKLEEIPIYNIECVAGEY